MRPKRRHSIVSDRHYRHIKNKKRFWQHLRDIPNMIFGYFEEFWNIHKDDIEYFLCIGSVPFVNIFSYVLIHIVPPIHVKIILAIVLFILSILNMISCFSTKKNIQLLHQNPSKLPDGYDLIIQNDPINHFDKNVVLSSWTPSRGSITVLWGYPPTTPVLIFLSETCNSLIYCIIHIGIAIMISYLIKSIFSKFETKIGDIRLLSFDAYKENEEFNKSGCSYTSSTESETLTKTMETVDLRERIIPQPRIHGRNENMIIEEVNIRNSPFYFHDLQPCAPDRKSVV